MVVGHFPILKLGGLFAKQISKPIANKIVQYCKNHSKFRRVIVMPPAQFYNWCEVKMKMWIMNLGKPVTVPSLNETMAIELGANLLGEGIIFIIAAGILYAEYARQVRKETAKEAARQEEISTLTYTIQELYFQAERQDAQIRELLRTVSDLEGKVVRIPWKSSTPKDQPPPENSPISTPQNIDVNNVNPPIFINNNWPEQRGIIFTAVSYLKNDVFSENDYYKYR